MKLKLDDGIKDSKTWASQADIKAVTTVTTHDLCRPKTHAKPTQTHASGREQVQRPSTEPQQASEQCEHARYLSYFR